MSSKIVIAIALLGTLGACGDTTMTTDGQTGASGSKADSVNAPPADTENPTAGEYNARITLDGIQMNVTNVMVLPPDTHAASTNYTVLIQFNGPNFPDPSVVSIDVQQSGSECGSGDFKQDLLLIPADGSSYTDSYPSADGAACGLTIVLDLAKGQVSGTFEGTLNAALDPSSAKPTLWVSFAAQLPAAQ